MKKILLLLLIVTLGINVYSASINFKGGLSYKQDVTTEVSSTANQSSTLSDTATKLALDTEFSLKTGTNTETGVGIKTSFYTISDQATALANDLKITDMTVYGMFKMNYKAYDKEGAAMKSTPYAIVYLGLPISASDAGDGAYTLVGKSFYELGVGLEYYSTLFEITYSKHRFEVDEQTDLTYIELDTINLKLGLKFDVFKGK